MIEVLAVKPSDVPSAWPYVEEHLCRAVERCDGQVHISDIYSSLIKETQFLYVIFDVDNEKVIGAATTEVVRYPQKTAVSVVLAGGKMFDEWIEKGIYIIEEFAKMIGADSVQIIGRRGWARKLTPHGYREASVVLSKTL